MKYKALITDFDGTLVGLGFTPSPQVKEAVRRLLESDIKVCIATGRTYHGIIESVCQQLNLTDLQIASAGAQIIDPKTNKIIWEEYLPEKEARSIVEFLINDSHPFALEIEEYVFTDDEDIKIRYGAGILFKEIKKADLSKVSKVFVPDISLEHSLRELFPNLNVIVAGLRIRHALDITSKKASKELAVLELAKILNIDPEEMIGLGDGYNDIPLLSVCGFKVAMENAPEELKEIADVIVPIVEQDGFLTLTNLLLQPNGDLLSKE